jgi:hypothetical protein
VAPETSEEVWHAAEAGASLDKTKDEIPVQREMEGRVQSADSLINALSPEHRLLRNEIKISQRLRGVRRYEAASNFVAVGVDDDAMTVDNIDLGMQREVLSYKKKAPGIKRSSELR